MMSPDAGGTNQVSQNRGYVAIPEVGDQVMVGFVHNHPDRLFVMGGMFHGGTGLGGFTDNRVKYIITISGDKVIFTEDESIIITDKSGNEIHLDTTESNFIAPETMTLNCKIMITNVGINSIQKLFMNATEFIIAKKMTSVVGDENFFNFRKLTKKMDDNSNRLFIIKKTVHTHQKR